MKKSTTNFHLCLIIFISEDVVRDTMQQELVISLLTEHV